MCNAISHHQLTLIDNRIQCEKCWGQWDLDGRELISDAQPPVQASGNRQLSPREIARVLVEELIEQYRLKDRAEIRALKYEAAQNSEVFIEEVLGRNQP